MIRMLPRLDRLVRIDPTRLRALAAVVAASLAFHLCAAAAGSTSWFTLVLVIASAGVVAVRTDGATELLLFVVLGFDWWGATTAPSWWCLPAALCLLVVHSAVLLMASGPDNASVPRTLLRLWVVRTAIVGAAGVVLGALLLAVRAAGASGPWWPAPLALVVLGAVAVALAEAQRGR